MDWKSLLREEMEATYRTTFSLLDRVDESQLGWKPATGSNWMTVGQLLHHLPEACGMCCKGFVTGDWGMPPQVEGDGDGEHSHQMPTAESMPAIASVAEARARLQADKELALSLVDQCSEEDLASKPTPAPWDPRPIPLGTRLLGMVQHLAQHKGQLYYYLKLQGQPVNTMNLWM